MGFGHRWISVHQYRALVTAMIFLQMWGKCEQWMLHFARHLSVPGKFVWTVARGRASMAWRPSCGGLRLAALHLHACGSDRRTSTRRG